MLQFFFHRIVRISESVTLVLPKLFLGSAIKSTTPKSNFVSSLSSSAHCAQCKWFSCSRCVDANYILLIDFLEFLKNKNFSLEFFLFDFLILFFGCFECSSICVLDCWMWFCVWKVVGLVLWSVLILVLCFGKIKIGWEVFSFGIFFCFLFFLVFFFGRVCCCWVVVGVRELFVLCCAML